MITPAGRYGYNGIFPGFLRSERVGQPRFLRIKRFQRRLPQVSPDRDQRGALSRSTLHDLNRIARSNGADRPSTARNIGKWRTTAARFLHRKRLAFRHLGELKSPTVRRKGVNSAICHTERPQSALKMSANGRRAFAFDGMQLGA